jgi:hypothetical protein
MLLLLNIIYSSYSNVSVERTSCMWWESCEDRKAPMSEGLCDNFEPPAVHWFKVKPSESDILCCVSIASHAGDVIRSWMLLPMWANCHTVHIEVNVIDDWAHFLLKLTTIHIPHRAAPEPDQSHLPTVLVTIPLLLSVNTGIPIE